MNRPKGLIVHYLRLACQKAGVTWISDNEAELSLIEQEIRAEARAEVGAEIAALGERIKDLERRTREVTDEAAKHIGTLMARVEGLERRMRETERP